MSLNEPLPAEISNFTNYQDLKNYIHKDPILDFLNNKINQEEKDIIDPNKEFNNFLSSKNLNFKELVIKLLKERYLINFIDHQDDLVKKYQKTLESLRNQSLIILNGIMLDTKNKLIGNPDIIISNQVLLSMIELLDQERYSKIFEYLKKNNQGFSIVNIKCSKFTFSSDKVHINNNNNNIRYLKSKNIIEQICLNQMLNQENSISFILGYTDTNIQPINIVKQFIVVDYNDRDREIKDDIYAGLRWLNDLKINIDNWSLDNLPQIPELYPNMKNSEDFPWHSFKIKLAKKKNEITLLPYCGPKKRSRCYELGINSFQNCNASNLNCKSNKRSKIVDSIINLNQKDNSILFFPRRIKNFKNLQKLKKQPVEFYVDFETVGTFIDDVSDSTSDCKIFMIGCFTVMYTNDFKNYTTEFKTFTSKTLQNDDEIFIVNQWLDYMSNIYHKYRLKNIKKKKFNRPPIYHWSKAEPIVLNKFWIHHQLPNQMTNLNFVDILDIFQNEPIIIKDTFSFSLKEISKSLYNLGMIETIWKESKILNGKNALFYAWNYYNSSIKDETIMEQIIEYNYVDCKVMQEIMNFLRSRI